MAKPAPIVHITQTSVIRFAETYTDTEFTNEQKADLVAKMKAHVKHEGLAGFWEEVGLVAYQIINDRLKHTCTHCGETGTVRIDTQNDDHVWVCEDHNY